MTFFTKEEFFKDNNKEKDICMSLHEEIKIKNNIDLERLKDAFHSCTSLKQVLAKINLPNNGKNSNMIKKLAEENGISLKHKNVLIKDKVKFIKLVSKSENLSDIAEALNIDKKSVLALAKKYNVNLSELLSSEFKDDLYSDEPLDPELEKILAKVRIAVKKDMFFENLKEANNMPVHSEIKDSDLSPLLTVFDEKHQTTVVKSSSQNHFELVYRLAPGQTVTVTDGVVTIK